MTVLTICDYVTERKMYSALIFYIKIYVYKVEFHV
jgi:hypothetical protein